ncbi:uncharacterized protein BDZ83DRAFT_296435 [Colletotrichum acutatum]|uniref:Uncharacterized protein n=1 Tax=Glomerella acutata TaxID=27357 RepID=A0AAD8XP55_GLOAC|nr:uncharacterized protein BDZ83DRAFT_296435 [Colletotrichum acutatum]KAK1731087.1 hypothetical protein BDZ83DRAFT_296435 [Colletotrichum acutatum]
MIEKLGYNHRRMGLLYGNENRRWLQTHTGWRERESTNTVQLMSLILPQQLLQEIWMQHGDEHHWNWGPQRSPCFQRGMPSVPEWPKECNPRRLVTQQHIRIPVNTATSHSVPARTGVGRAKRQRHERKLDHRFLSRQRRLTRKETTLGKKQSLCSPSVPGLVLETKTCCNSSDCRHMSNPSKSLLLAWKLQHAKLTATLIDILNSFWRLDTGCRLLRKRHWRSKIMIVDPGHTASFQAEDYIEMGLPLAYLDSMPSTGRLYLVALLEIDHDMPG